MQERATSEEIYDRAADWVAREDRAPLGNDERDELERWLAQDSRHYGAYMRAQSVSAWTESAHALGAAYQPDDVDESPAKPNWRRRGLVGALAASLALAVLLVWPTSPQVIETARGETRSVPLADGSTLTLNTDTRVEVRLGARKRVVTLVWGEALFEVAKDRARPFVVTAANVDVTAVGTEFTVRSLPSLPLRVAVQEGIVDVAPEPDERVRVPALVQVDIARNGPIVRTRLDSDKARQDLLWREGKVAFSGVPLSEAAAQFARYSPVRIYMDEAAARHRITGLFSVKNPLGFAEAVGVSYDLRVKMADGRITISEK